MNKIVYIILCAIVFIFILPLVFIITWLRVGYWFEEREAIDNYKSTYGQNVVDFEKFTDGMNEYLMQLQFDNMKFELLLQKKENEWRGTLTHSVYDHGERVLESFETQIVDGFLFIHSEPQKRILVTDFFFAQFDPESFNIKQAGYALFTSEIIEAEGSYDLEKGKALLELFEQNFISIFSIDVDFYRYYLNVDSLNKAIFSSKVLGFERKRFCLYFSLDEEHEIVFEEKMLNHLNN